MERRRISVAKGFTDICVNRPEQWGIELWKIVLDAYLDKGYDARNLHRLLVVYDFFCNVYSDWLQSGDLGDIEISLQFSPPIGQVLSLEGTHDLGPGTFWITVEPRKKHITVYESV
jgi:hypothetical protein